jgi:hypothetical protein
MFDPENRKLERSGLFAKSPKARNTIQFEEICPVAHKKGLKGGGVTY